MKSMNVKHDLTQANSFVIFLSRKQQENRKYSCSVLNHYLKFLDITELECIFFRNSKSI